MGELEEITKNDNFKIFKTPNYLWDVFGSKAPLNSSIIILDNTILKIEEDWNTIYSLIESFYDRIYNLYSKFNFPSYLTTGKINKPFFIKENSKVTVNFLTLRSRFDEDILYIVKYPDGSFEKGVRSFEVDSTGRYPGTKLDYQITAQTKHETSNPKTYSFLVIDEEVLSVTLNTNIDNNTLRIRYIPNKTNIVQMINTSDIKDELEIIEYFNLNTNEFGWDVKRVSNIKYNIHIKIQDKYFDKREFYLEFE